MDSDALTLSLLGERAFAGYQLPWNELLDESDCRSFFLKWEWMYTYWRTAERNNATLLVVLCHDAEKLVGIAPFYAYSTKFMNFPVTKVAFLGDGVAGDYMDVIARPGYEERCCKSVLQFLRESKHIDYDLVELDAVCSDAHLFRYATQGHAGDIDLSVDFRFECPRAVLGSSYAEYVARLTPSTRYGVGRRQRRFERAFRGVEVVNVDLHQRMELVDVLFELHRRRWESARPGQSTFYSGFRKRFSRQLLGRLEIGDGYFSLVSVAGEPVSIVYVFVYKKQAFFYQNGWSPELAPYGIGLVGVHNALRHAVESGCETFDFLRGEEDYKYKFCGDVRRAYAVRMFGNGARGRVLESLFTLKGVVKRRLAGPRGSGAGAGDGANGARSAPGMVPWS